MQAWGMMKHGHRYLAAKNFSNSGRMVSGRVLNAVVNFKDAQLNLKLCIF
jgi:hypothetical protein